jgi:hypothetical protein
MGETEDPNIDSHVRVGPPRGIWRTDTSIDKTVIPVLQSWNVNRKNFFYMVRKANLLNLDAGQR